MTVFFGAASSFTLPPLTNSSEVNLRIVHKNPPTTSVETDPKYKIPTRESNKAGLTACQVGLQSRGVLRYRPSTEILRWKNWQQAGNHSRRQQLLYHWLLDPGNSRNGRLGLLPPPLCQSKPYPCCTRKDVLSCTYLARSPSRSENMSLSQATTGTSNGDICIRVPQVLGMSISRNTRPACTDFLHAGQ